MAKKSKNPLDILKSKPDILNWEAFRLLENLLVFCVERDRAGDESGMLFRIGADPERKSLCVLFNIDRKKDPLIRQAKMWRPDYLVLYADRQTCTLTIIELKGRSKKDASHGVDQIKTFRDLLKQEMSKHLPRFEVAFQGILLTPPNSELPLKKIEEERKKDFVILPLQWPYKFELFPYISRRHKSIEKYKHENLRGAARPKFIEQVLTRQALHKRINDPFHSTNFTTGKNRTGIYINFALSENGAYAALKTDDKTAIIAVRDDVGDCLAAVRNELSELGILNHRKCRFETIA
jgi:hypothetical protein